MLPPLTSRQADIYRFLIESRKRGRPSPSVREIARHAGLASNNAVLRHLASLEEKGYIRRRRRSARGIEIRDEVCGAERGYRLLGAIAAGRPREAIEHEERFALEDWISPECFAFDVRGDSMIDAGVRDGDRVFVQPRSTAEPGEMVVVRTPEHEATVKFWRPEPGRICLQPANEHYAPIYVRHAEVLGVVVGVLRRFRS